MAALRIKCQVLQAIALDSPATSLSVQERLPHLTTEQVQKAIYNLLSEDRVTKVGTSGRSGPNGRPCFMYEVRDDWEPGLSVSAKSKTGRKSYREELHTGVKKSDMANITIRFRDQKIRLIQRLIPSTHDTDRDLLIGVLADYGVRYGER